MNRREETGAQDRLGGSAISILMRPAHCGWKISTINHVTVPDVRSHYIFQMSEFQITFFPSS